jgi:hypothetical protein
VLLTAYPNGYDGMPRDEVAKSIGEAARSWGPDAVTCADGSSPYLEVVTSLADQGAPAPPVAYDGRNTIVFETRGWSGDDGSTQIAVTYSFTQPGGQIVDTDMRINATAFRFANLDPGSTGDGATFDLQNAITHEMGHVVGLEHTCLKPEDDLGPVDDAGNLVPYCGDASAEIRETTMYPTTDPGVTWQRTLADDDIRAVCTIYPAGANPRVCPLDLPDDGCGCGAAGTMPGSLSALLVAAALALSRARLRRAGSTRTPRPAWCWRGPRAPAG